MLRPVFMALCVPVLVVIFMNLFILALPGVFISKPMQVSIFAFMKVFIKVFMAVFMKNHPVCWTGCQMYPQNRFCGSTAAKQLGSLRPPAPLLPFRFHRAPPRDP
jgi:hypothetical protein